MATSIVQNIPHLVKLLISIVNGFHIRSRRLLGRPYVYSDKTITKAFIVMVYFRLNSFRSLARFLEDHHDFARACGIDNDTPSYRTLSRRLKTLDSVLWSFTYQVIAVLVKYHLVTFNVTATDSSLLEAKGKPTHKGKLQCLPTDHDARWGFSESRDWLFGYKIHITSTVLVKDKTLIPLSWTITSANRHDSKLLIPLLEKTYLMSTQLKRRMYYALCDKGYDHNKNYYWCNAHQMKLVTPVRRFKKKAISTIKLWTKRFVDSVKGRILYRRRADSERLLSQIKEIFLIDPLPVIGYKNVSSYMNTVCLSYLLGVLYNHLNGRSLRAIKSLVA